MKKKILIGAVGILLVASLGVNAWLFLQNQELSGRASRVGSVCGDEDVKKFNNLISGDIDLDKIKEFSNSIKEKSGDSDSDANCIYINLISSVFNSDKDLYKNNLSKLRSLNSEGQNPSMKFIRSLSMDEFSDELVEDVQGKG